MATPRERILHSARVLARDAGLPSLGQVARHAGVSRATLHRHFHSRQQLLRVLDLEPELGARDRALAAAIELLARDGLAQLAMDEVAERAGVSRANLYRLFPGKAALFRELVRIYAPIGPVAATLTALGDRPPQEVMPALARAIVRHVEGRLGLIRSLLFEVSAPSDEPGPARELAIDTALAPVAAYLERQMQAGRLRRMPPLLAIQAFAGPLIAHMLLRPLANELLGFDMPAEAAVAELANLWVRGMQVDEPSPET